jgi:hypothetical protein
METGKWAGYLKNYLASRPYRGIQERAQGTQTEGEDSLQLTSSLSLFCKKGKYYIQ